MSEPQKSGGTLGDRFPDHFRKIKSQFTPSDEQTNVVPLSEDQLAAAEPQMPEETEEVQEKPKFAKSDTFDIGPKPTREWSPPLQEENRHEEVDTATPVGEEFPNTESEDDIPGTEAPAENDNVQVVDEGPDFVDVEMKKPQWETFSGISIPEPEDLAGFTAFLNAVPHDPAELCRTFDIDADLLNLWKGGAFPNAAPDVALREQIIEWLVQLDRSPNVVSSDTTFVDNMYPDTYKAHPDVPSDVERDPEREARLNKLLEYADPSRRDMLRARYVGYSRFDLEQMTNIFEQVLGQAGANEQLRAINAFYLECLADPRHRAAQLYLESKGVKFNRLASEISRVIGDDVIVNNLRHNEYLETARAAFNDLAVLKQMVLAIEPHLDFFHSGGKVDAVPDEMAVPASMAHLIAVLRHTWAHLRASVSHAKVDEENLRRTNSRLAETETRLHTVQSKLDTAEQRLARRYREITEGITLIYSREIDKFLGHRDLPNGRNNEGIRLSLTGFFWTENIAMAMRFDSKQLARTSVDEIILKSRMITRPGREANLAGQALDVLDFATPALRVPVRD